MHSVLIADDHPVARAGLRRFLASESAVSEVGEARLGLDTMTQLRGRQWDLLLLDVHRPGRAGMVLLQEVKTEFPAIRVLVISGLAEDHYAPEALRVGAAGWLSKDSTAAELIAAVCRVLEGRRYISSRLAEQLVSSLGKQNIPRHELLSARERQVFERLAGGVTITRLARELKISVKTVSTYRTRLLEKMSLKSNADMTAYAIRHEMQ